MQKLHIKTGDTVKVIAGKYKGKTGKIIQSFPRLGRVVVEGINLAKRHIRTRRAGEKGQVIEFSMPIDASNVALTSDAAVPVAKKPAAKKAKAKAPETTA
ncbi:MAG: 50S ribosomal protein L24 [Patescibacteria group bacterium]